MKPLHEIRRIVVKAFNDLYAMPSNIWAGIIAGTVAPYFAYSVFWGIVTSWGVIIYFLFFGLFIIIPIILFILPLSFLFLKRMRKLYFLQVMILGFSIQTLITLLYNFWTYMEGVTGTYRGGAGYHYIDGEWTTTGLISLFIYQPLYASPVGILGAVAGWLAAFGFKASVDGASLR